MKLSIEFSFITGARYRLFILLVAMSGLQLGFAQDNFGFHVLREIHVGGKGGWDYIAVHTDLKRLYVAHDSLVNILDEVTGDSLGIISNTPGVHGIAFATSFGKGYTSNGRTNNLTVFDLKSNRTTGSVTVGTNPDAILYDSFSKKIFACNGRSQDASVVDPSGDTMVTMIALGGKPEAPVSDGAGNIYVNIEDKNEVVHVNTKTWKVEHRWKLTPGESPTGIAMDRSSRRLFVGCDRMMIVLNAENGSIVSRLPIGDRCDGIAFDPSSGCAFASNGDGTLTQVHEVNADSFQVVATVPTKRGARTLALDDQSHHVFLPTAQYEPASPVTPENPHPRPRIIPGTFEVLEVGK